MKSGERYIIEIEEVVGNLAKIKGFNALVFDEVGLNKLEKIDGTYFSRDEVSREKEFSYRNGKDVGYSEGYDKGFKDGVKHQESMKPTEPHEPQVGDIYRDSWKHVFAIISIRGLNCHFLFSDGRCGDNTIDGIKKYGYEYLGNIKADLEAFQKVVGSYE